MIKSILGKLFESVIAKKINLQPDNINPIKTPSTAFAYAGATAMATLQAYPQTEYDVLIQLAIGAISAYCFYTKKK